MAFFLVASSSHTDIDIHFLKAIPQGGVARGLWTESAYCAYSGTNNWARTYISLRAWDLFSFSPLLLHCWPWQHCCSGFTRKKKKGGIVSQRCVIQPREEELAAGGEREREKRSLAVDMFERLEGELGLTNTMGVHPWRFKRRESVEHPNADEEEFATPLHNKATGLVPFPKYRETCLSLYLFHPLTYQHKHTNSPLC